MSVKEPDPGRLLRIYGPMGIFNLCDRLPFSNNIHKAFPIHLRLCCTTHTFSSWCQRLPLFQPITTIYIMTPNLDLQDRRHFSMTSAFIAIFLLASFCHTQQLQPQQAVDCTDPTSTISPSCWDALEIPAWISQFAGANSTCANSNLTHLAGANSSWGACFILTINDGLEGQTIAENLGLLNANITVDTLYQQALEFKPVEDRPRYSYVLTALSRIRGLFLGWDDIVSSNTTALESDISTILAALDPGNQTSFSGDDLYQALFLGLPYFLATNGTGIPF